MPSAYCYNYATNSEVRIRANLECLRLTYPTFFPFNVKSCFCVIHVFLGIHYNSCSCMHTRYLQWCLNGSHYHRQVWWKRLKCNLYTELHTYCTFHYIGVAHDEGLQVEYLPLTVYSLIELSHQNNFHNIVQHPYVYVPLFRVARTCVAICLISRPSLVLVMVWGHYYTEMIASRLIWITNQKSKIWHAPLWAWLFSEIKATITQLCFVALAVPTWQSFSRWPNSILDLPSKYTTACVVNKNQKFLRCL